MRINDAHCHFFSTNFFRVLAGQKSGAESLDWMEETERKLGWEVPRSDEALAHRWVKELDRNRVTRAALIASVPGDEDSVARAVACSPERFVGFFMLDPRPANALQRLTRAIRELELRGVCLFPAMQGYSLKESFVGPVLRVLEKNPGTALFVHCGALSVGVRDKLGLPSPFDLTCSNPLEVHYLAARYPEVPMIIPHFGAGLLREALMAAHLSPNILLDTSSSNGWVRYQPGLTLLEVFRTSLELLGPEKLLFGTDSSFFPRGWQAGLLASQLELLEKLGLSPEDKGMVLAGNFDRLFP